MAETPQKAHQTPRSSKHQPQVKPKPKPSPSLTPATPQTLAPRRSTRRTSLHFNPTPNPHKHDVGIENPIEDAAKTPRKAKKIRERSVRKTPRKSINNAEEACIESVKTPKSAKKSEKPGSKNGDDFVEVQVSFSPASPDPSESMGRKRKRGEGGMVVTRAMASSKSEKKRGSAPPRKRVYYKKVVYDGGEFEVGDDVYVKRREEASSDGEEPEMEDCRVCFKVGRAVMIECDDCLGGFHLKCLKPPLKEVPEGGWICRFCESRRSGKVVELPVPPEGKKRLRTMREKLLSSDLWAACIER
jgi:origin recognition complex subunit 1